MSSVCAHSFCMQDGKLRRNVDLRIVSYALSVLNDNPENQELAVIARFLAAAALQLAGGYKALIETCKASAASEALRKSMDPDKAKRCAVLFDALSCTLDDHRMGTFQELIELIGVFAGQAMADDEAAHGLNIWANSLGLDTSPLLVHDDDEIENIVEVDDAIKRRSHKPRKRATRRAYDQDRFEDLIREAVAVGVDASFARLVRGRVEIVGKHSRKGDVHLRWLRGSMAEAEGIVDRVNAEIEKLRSFEPSRGSLSA